MFCMKKILFFLYLSGLACATMAQADPVLMRIDGKPVLKSEFEYNFNKNKNEIVQGKKSAKEYLDLFISYKLKAQAAMDAKLDTAGSFRKEFYTYRNQLILPLLVPQTRMEEECRIYYDRMKENLQGKEIIQPAHIFLRVRQDAKDSERLAIKARMDSIYQALQDGADFADMAKKLSEDKASAAKGGVLPWIGPNQTLKEFEDTAYALNPGDISQPFLSTVGYHIIKLMGRKDLEPYEELKPNIAQYLESRGLKNRLAEQVLDSIATKEDNNKSVEEILEAETERLCAEDQELKYLVQEYHDGLLVYEISNREIWGPATKDTVGIENYFKKNKKDFAWKEPRYNGMIYYCKQEKDVKNVRKALKRVASEKWIETIEQQFNKDSVSVRMEKRLFSKGDNRNVDVLGLKLKNKKIKPVDGFPYVGLIGKRLKKGPGQWTDCSNEVIAGYQNDCEESYVAKLREKYKVEVDEKVLNSVK